MHSEIYLNFWQLMAILVINLGFVNCQTSEAQMESTHHPIDSLKKNPFKNSSIVQKDTNKIKYPSLILENQEGNLAPILQKMAKGEPVQIVCFGNSITRGYKVNSFGIVDNPYPKVLEKLWQEHYKNPKIKLFNEGHNGWRSDQALNNLSNLVLNQKPHLVILEFGINDAYSHFSTTVFENKMQSIVNELVKYNHQVLLLTPTPITTPYNQKVIAYCKILEKIAQKSSISFLNIHQIISQRAENEQVKKADLLPDGVHFADDKYAWIAEAIFEFCKGVKN
jgi:lysophospholipase L1-like esterase